MKNMFYNAGMSAALTKLGMELQFESPRQAEEHYRTRASVGHAGNVLGMLPGAAAGAAVGTGLGGPLGGLGGSAAGTALGGTLGGAPLVTAYDAQYDLRHRAVRDYNTAINAMNTAAGLPAVYY